MESKVPDRTYGFGGPGTSLVNVTVIGIAVCCPIVLNRIFWRFRTVKTIGVDDYLILVSLCLLMILGIISLTAVNFGYGRNQHELTSTEAERALLVFYFYQIVYKINIATTKLSVISLYLRIFRDKHWFRATCIFTALVIILYTITAVIINIFECQPISWAWEKNTAPPPPPPPTTTGTRQGKCINILAFWLTTATVNITTELTILIASIFVVIKLELPTRQKTALVCILFLGIFVFITSILRITTLHPSSPNASSNTTGSTYLSTLWSTIEASTAITCACLPMLRTPIQRFLPAVFGSLRSGARSARGGGSRGGGASGASRGGHRSHSRLVTSPSVAAAASPDLVTATTGFVKSSATTTTNGIDEPPTVVHAGTGPGAGDHIIPLTSTVTHNEEIQSPCPCVMARADINNDQRTDLIRMSGRTHSYRAGSGGSGSFETVTMMNGSSWSEESLYSLRTVHKESF